MSELDFASIRKAMASLSSDHDASGTSRPTVEDIFTPEQHANALDPNTPVVVGARGAGKSFWAGVLNQDETRRVAANAYPHLGLKRLVVRAGYTGLDVPGAATTHDINDLVPAGDEALRAFDFWQAVIARLAGEVLSPDSGLPSIRQVMRRHESADDSSREWRRLDGDLSASGKTLLVTFDALDTWSRDWRRSSLLTNALFEVLWSLRARRAIRAKVFIRPEQLDDESLQFVKMPKLRSGRVELEWSQTDLYGLLYWRLTKTSDAKARRSFHALIVDEGTRIPDDVERRRHDWSLTTNPTVQEAVMERLAGRYMGRGTKKGRTYDWPYNHLADAKGQVTPRSFVKLFVEAARYQPVPENQMMTADGI